MKTHISTLSRYLFLFCLLCLWACSNENMDDSEMEVEPKSGPISVCYVEVNNNNLLNIGSYVLAGSDEQLFDIGIIFASNINFDAEQGKAVLHHNENVTRVLENRAQYIEPLQDKGIKVLLSILGNHQGVGVANFTSRSAAEDFAIQVAGAVEEFQLDGVDIDDEYAKYGEQGHPVANDSSFVMFVTALRDLLPDKIISLYNIGPASSRLSWNGTDIGPMLDYSWNPYYGSYKTPQIPGMTREQLGPAAVWIGQTPSGTAVDLAKRTVQDGYGVFLTYDLSAQDASSYLSGISEALYGQSTEVSGMIYDWP